MPEIRFTSKEKDTSIPFEVTESQALPFEVGEVPSSEDRSRLHSYFEDGRDPDDNLELPKEIMTELAWINKSPPYRLYYFRSIANSHENT